jgi:membrane protease YdiL (CAAX protease family)
MAPVIEEILWRKQIFGLFLNKFSPVVSIILSSALFALYHQQLVNIGFLFICGLLFCLVYYLSHSIEFSILLHSFLNLSGIFIEHRYITINYYIQFFNTIALMVICGVAIYLIIKYLLRNAPMKKLTF